MAQWTVDEAHQRLQSGLAPLVDLRSAEERQSGGAPHALPLPMVEFDLLGRQRPVPGFGAALAALAKAAKAPPMLICAQGLRSRQAAAWLALQGIACDEVPGGFEGAEPELGLPPPLRLGWRAAGLPWVSGASGGARRGRDDGGDGARSAQATPGESDGGAGGV